MTQIAMQQRLSDIVDEYRLKLDNIQNLVSQYEDIQKAINMNSSINGVYGGSVNFSRISPEQLAQNLLKSAWRHVYQGLNISTIASATDRKKFEEGLEREVLPFTLENIRATFGDYILNPRANVLRGLAEVFCLLDNAYKSHDKVKIGVKGLPKRIILSSVQSYGWGRERLTDVINALAALQQKPLAGYGEISDLLNDGDIMLTERVGDNGATLAPARGVRLVRFKNGNAHLFFQAKELFDINKGLAEYYGEVLADCPEERPKKQTSTAVSKDLQYYPTPQKVVDAMLDDLYIKEGDRILEPSCGCGRIMNGIKWKFKGTICHGVEVDPIRAEEARAKGHRVLTTNFLETVPSPVYDRVIMNPPFYGKHYVKHIEHALKFLKSGGTLTAILPATARYDHGLVDGKWRDLPVGSFSESGTNVNTTILTINK